MLIEDAALAEAMERQFRLDVARSREVIRRPVRGPHRISAALPTRAAARGPRGPARGLPAAPAASAGSGPPWPCAT